MNLAREGVMSPMTWIRWDDIEMGEEAERPSLRILTGALRPFGAQSSV